MFELTARGEAALTKMEGDIPYVYDDAHYPTRIYKPGTKISGNLTAGVGHLISRGSKIVDPAGYAWVGKDIPPALRRKWLDEDTDVAEASVESKVKVDLPTNRKEALIMFAFNVGVAAFEGSTLLKRVNAAQFDAVPAEFRKWTKTTINGKKVTSEGLKKRREAELAYWNGGQVFTEVHQGTQIATAEPTKPTPMEIGSLAVGGVSAASSFASATGFVGIAIGVAIIVAVAIGGAILVRKYFFPR